MKKINIRESLLQFDKDTSCQYDLTTLYEACSLDEEDKKKLVQYIDAKDIDATNRFLTNKATEHGFMESVSDDVSDDELASFGVEKETLTEDTDADTIEQKIKDKTFDALLNKYDEEFVHDYCEVQVKELDDCFEARVNAEVSYSDLEDLGTELTKVITEFDPSAYFEPECPGRLVAYVRKDQSEDIVDEEILKHYTDKFNAVKSRDELEDVYAEFVKFREHINWGTKKAIYDVVDAKIEEFPEEKGTDDIDFNSEVNFDESLNEDTYYDDDDEELEVTYGVYIVDIDNEDYDYPDELLFTFDDSKKAVRKAKQLYKSGKYEGYRIVVLEEVDDPDNLDDYGHASDKEVFCIPDKPVKEPNDNRLSEDGTYYYDDSQENLSLKLRNKVKKVIFKEGTTTINQYAFGQCSNLISVTIPDSVTTIDNYAFEGCTSLQSVTISDSVERIKEKAFYNCKSLTSITIGNSVTYIGEYAFWCCSNLESITIPDSVTKMYTTTFWACKNNFTIKCNKNSYAYEYAEKYDIPVALLNESLTEDSDTEDNHLTEDGTYYYDGTHPEQELRDKITKVIVKDGVLKIYYAAFKDCTSLETVIISDSVIEIDDDAFCNCVNLTNVTIGNSVETIGQSAFADCRSLKNIIIPNTVSRIDNASFFRCKSLTNIIIPGSVQSIGRSAFFYCANLTNVTLDNGVKTIDEDAFMDCASLQNITIPDSVIYIDKSAFWGCKELTIKCNKNSYAYKYAEKYDIPVNLLDESLTEEMTSWTDVYEKFTDIVRKNFPNTELINKEVEDLYNEHKGETMWDEAYYRWCQGDESLTEDTPEKYEFTHNEPEFNKFTVGGKDVPYTSHEEAKAHMKEDYPMESFIDELVEYMKGNDLYYSPYVNEEGNLVITVEDGDWKHEHLYLDRLIGKFFFNRGLIVDINSEVIESDDLSDCYSAHHIYELKDLIFSMSISESIKITPDSKMKEIDIEDKSETGDVGHPIKVGLKDPTNKPINETMNNVFDSNKLKQEYLEDTMDKQEIEELAMAYISVNSYKQALNYILNNWDDYYFDDYEDWLEEVHPELFDDLDEGFLSDVANVGKAVAKEVKNSKTFQKHVQSKVDKVKNSDAYKNISNAVKDTDTYKNVKQGIDNAKDVVKSNVADKNRKATDISFNVDGKDYIASELKYKLNGKEISADEVAKMNAFQRRKVDIEVPQGVKPIKEGVASATQMNWDDDDDFTYDAEVWEDDMGVVSNKDFFAEGSDYTWMERVSSVETLDFDNWAVWSALNQHTGETEYFVVDEDTEFIDWGPVDTEKEAKEFLQSKVDDYNLDESLDEAWVMSLSDATRDLNDADKNGFYKVMDNITCDPSKCPLDQLENEVGEIAARYTDGNASPEYEGEDFADEEYSGSKIYNAILKLYGRDGESLTEDSDISDELVVSDELENYIIEALGIESYTQGFMDTVVNFVTPYKEKLLNFEYMILRTDDFEANYGENSNIIIAQDNSCDVVIYKNVNNVTFDYKEHRVVSKPENNSENSLWVVYESLTESVSNEDGSKVLTYDELLELALENYNIGGDTVYECWDEEDFNNYVEEFGPITYSKALEIFKTNNELNKEHY